MHNDVLLLLATVPFLAAPLAVDRRDRRPDGSCGWPIGTGIAVVTLGYFFAGYWKLVRSGLDWVTSDNVRLSVAWGPKPAVGRWDWLADLVTATPWFGHVIAAFTLAFELSFPIALFVRRTRVPYAAIGTTLHVSTYFLFGLDYWAWIGVLWILFVDWPGLVDRVRPTGFGPTGRGPEDHRHSTAAVVPSHDRLVPVAAIAHVRSARARDQKGPRWRSTSS